MIVEKVPCEAFVLQEVMSTPKFYDNYRALLNILSVETPIIRSTRDLLVSRILFALYGEEVADQTFAVFRENRKSMRLNPLSEMELYGNDENQRISGNNNPPPSPNIPPLSLYSISALTPDQMRSIISVIFSISGSARPIPNPVPTNLTSNPVMYNVDGESDANTDVNGDVNNNRFENSFQLEIALGRLQSYY